MSLAIMLTCFNRKNKTIQCLESLYRQKDIPSFDLYVCDDKSTDGTAKAIRNEFPKAIVLKGTGNLFWSRGMHVAMKAAVEKEYDYYLMVNDDVEFFDTMWNEMYLPFVNHNLRGVVGCMLSKETGQQSYGGAKFYTTTHGDYIGSMLAPSSEHFMECDLANWNCFLIDQYVVKEVGLIDSRYEHAMGDFDYSFRMKQKDIPILLAKEYVGYCENNLPKGTFKDSSQSRRNRLKKLFAPNGLPIKSWWHFTMTYYVHSKYRNFFIPYIKYLTCIFLGRDC